MSRSTKILLLGYALGSVTALSAMRIHYSLKHPPSGETDTQKEKRLPPVGLVRPLLECRSADASAIRTEMMESLEQMLTKVERAENVHVLLYYKDYQDGRWFGHRDSDVFAPGSLNKLPLLIGYLKQEEREPGYLDRRVRFDEPELMEYYKVQGVQPSVRLKLGTEYNLRELIEATIVRSDNVAAVMLSRLEKGAVLDRTTQELDIAFDVRTGPLRTRTVVEFSSYFKALINGTYLTDKHSDEALRILARSEFHEGLSAGVPQTIPVAHKFGEGILGDRYFLSDCGLIYAPSSPYLLCISVEARGHMPSASIIRDVSAEVYQRHEQRNAR